MKIKARITVDSNFNPLLKLESYEVRKSVGALVDSYAIFELVQPSRTQPPCFALLEKGKKQIHYVSEIESPNQKIRYIPYERVPWALATTLEKYESYESLWKEVSECVYQHLDLPKPNDHKILTAWIFATYLLEKWETVPFLQFLGAFETGKSHALELLAQLCFRGWLAVGVTEPNIFRPTEQFHPTLLLDETESAIDRQTLIGLLNSSYRRGYYVPRQEKQADGSFETVFYDLFGFKAIAGTKDLPQTTKSRCITFKMTKATRKVKIRIDKKWCEHLRNKLLLWRFRRLLECEDSG